MIAIVIGDEEVMTDAEAAQFMRRLQNALAKLEDEAALESRVLPWPAGEDAKRAVDEYMAAQKQ